MHLHVAKIVSTGSSEVLYADIYFLHQTITFVASFLSGNCHGRRYLLVWYAGGERTPRRDLCVRSHVGHQLLPKIDDAVCNDSVWNGLLQRTKHKNGKFYFVSFLFVKAFVSLSGNAVCIFFSHCVFGNLIVHRAFLHTRHTVLL